MEAPVKYNTQLKTCNDCKQELDTTLFIRSSKKKDGLANICKVCYNKRYGNNKYEHPTKRYKRIEATQELLKSLFEYTDGKLRLSYTRRGDCLNDVVGSSTTKVLMFTHEGNHYAISKARAIWIYVHGSIPKGLEVGFKDQDCTNISIENLYLLTRSLKTAIRPPSPKVNTSGYKGVSYSGGLWHCSVTYNKKRYRTCFKDKEIANDWCVALRKKLGITTEGIKYEST